VGRDRVRGPSQAGTLNGQASVEGKPRPAAAKIGCCRGVLLRLRGQHRELIGEAGQELEHLLGREEAFGHPEAHQALA
jgi:hypothetical protein